MAEVATGMKVDRRRRVMLLSGAAAALFWAGVPKGARADEDKTNRHIEDLFGGVKPVEDASIHLEIPEFVQDGGKVPLRVSVDGPMTAEDHVKRIVVLAEENPRPSVAAFHLSPSIPKAEIATRIRLSHTQHVIVLAERSSGAIGRAEGVVTVVNGGCS